MLGIGAVAAGFPIVRRAAAETQTSHVRGRREMSWPGFRAITTPHARNRAHKPHTSGAEINIYRGFEWVPLIGKSVTPPEFPNKTHRGMNSLERNIRRFSTSDPGPLRFSSVSTRSPRMLIKAHYSS